MAEQRVSLVLSVTGQQAFEKAAKSVNKVEKAANKIQGTGGKLGGAFRGIGAAAGGAIPGVSGLGAALSAALGPLAAVTSAAALVSKALGTAFERGAAEQKLRNFTDSTEEYNAALAVAADTAEKFGMSQTEATTALADTYSRLKGLGFGLKETSEIYKGFQTVVLQSGTSAEDAAGAFLQLSQALGSGKLQGDELRAILERLPQLAQLIATSMGKSAAEIRTLGQEGKITSEVIYKALSEAAKGADEFGNKLNPQQTALKNLGRAADEAFNALGKALSPAVIAVADGITWAVNEMVEIWNYLAANVFPKVVAAVQPVVKAIQDAFKDVDWAAIGKAIKLYIIGYFEALAFVVGNVSKAVAFVINLFKDLANTPAFKALLWPLQKAVELLGGVKDPVKEWTAEQKKNTEETAKTVEQHSKLPAKIEDAKAKTKELKKEQEKVSKKIQEIAQRWDQAYQDQEARNDKITELANQRLSTEMTINSILLDQANAELEKAKTAQERENAAFKIYQLTVKQAELEKVMAQAAVREAVRKSRAQADYLALKAEEISAEVELAMAKGTYNEHHEKALALANRAADLAWDQYETQKLIAKEQMKEIDAIYESKVKAAELAYAQNRVFENTESAAQSANKLGANIAKAVTHAQKLAAATSALDQAMSGMGATSTGGGSTFSASSSQGKALMASGYGVKVGNGQVAYDINKMKHMRPEQVSALMGAVTDGRKWDGTTFGNPYTDRTTQWFANGGYIKRGEVGIVGEAGPELVEGPAMVTSNPRLRAAMGSGAISGGGGSAVQITYNGETIEFKDEEYIKKKDVQNLVGQAVDKVKGFMGGSAKFRLDAGLA